MALNLLLVEDEAGIREGMAAFLRLKGHRVETADSCDQGIRMLGEGDFDLVVTDWHLGDGTGQQVLVAAPCPALVISGVTECVDLGAADAEVIAKPVMPDALVERVETMVAKRAAAAPAQQDLGVPEDCAARIRLIEALAEAHVAATAAGMQILDDGTYVQVCLDLNEPCPDLRAALEPLGGDLRELQTEAGLRLELRFFRDGRAAGQDAVVGPGQDWPEQVGSLGVDFDDGPAVSPARFLELVELRNSAVAAGRHVYFMNVPAHLRLYLEVLGKAHDMPMREQAGPRLPEVLSHLWR